MYIAIAILSGGTGTTEVCTEIRGGCGLLAQRVVRMLALDLFWTHVIAYAAAHAGSVYWPHPHETMFDIPYSTAIAAAARATSNNHCDRILIIMVVQR